MSQDSSGPSSASSGKSAAEKPVTKEAASSSALAARQWNVALIGNPNTGKSTLFNALAGMNARVGNYPGVTVEKKLGRFALEQGTVQLIDLPGTYSLSARSADELVSVRVLLGEQKEIGHIDAVICIVDATHLQRNFYLFSQVLDLGIPTVLVLNMWDEAEKQKIQIDIPGLEKRLGVPVIPATARKGVGVAEIKSRLQKLLTGTEAYSHQKQELFPESFQQARQEISTEVSQLTGQEFRESLAERLLLDVHGEAEREVLKQHPVLNERLEKTRQSLAEQGCPVPAIEPRVRYGWAREQLSGLVVIPESRAVKKLDVVDRWLTHRFFGPVLFAVIMLAVFQAIFVWADPLMGAIEGVQESAADWVKGLMAAGALRSLIIDGLIGGVGSVVVFLPQIVILFLFIAILEDCGYLARAAYIMDRFMTKMGLGGKSFVPLMSSFACAIPGIMSTRTIENRKDRFVTMLIAPLMSCSARIPVYMLMILAFIPPISYAGGWLSLHQLVLFAFYMLGVVVAVPTAWILKKTFFRGEPAPFVMELPSFKWPSLRVVFQRVWDRAKAFLTQAGTLIFLTTVLIWAAGYFPGDRSQQTAIINKIEQTEWEEGSEELAALEDELNVLSADLLNNSYLGKAGHFIEPVVRPLGWDWRLGVGVLASFPAREVVVGTLGAIFSLGDDQEADSEALIDQLRAAKHPDGRPLFTIPVVLSVMVFFALCAQCGATFMVMKQEMNGWTWPVLGFVYMTVLAYVGAFLTFWIGSWISFNVVMSSMG